MAPGWYGNQTPEPPKPRLWLDYTAGNLRNTENLDKDPSLSQTKPSNPKQDHPPLPQPETYGRAPRTEPSNQNSKYRPLPQAGRPGRASNDRARGSREDYTIPNDYDNLDEIAAPSPVESPQKERRQGYLEDRGADSSSTDQLNEIAAPERGQEYFEDRDSSSPPSDEKAEKDNVSPRRQRASKLATEIYTISYLIFFSFIGTLSRLGLQALTFYPGAPVQIGLLWANVGGSLIMGFLSEDRQLFREEWGTPSSPKQAKGHDEEKANHAAVKKTLPLYIGLATGFCGSFTSFSSFMRDCFFALSNALQVPISHPSTAPISETLNVHRNPGYSFMAVLAVLIVTIGLSLGALQLGAHIALGLEPFTPSIPFLFARKIVDRSVVLLALGCWLGAIFMAIWPPDRPQGPVGNPSWAQETWRSEALFALVFAPLGCLLRFYASLHLNGKIKSFPLGTFAVNIFGTMLEAIFLDLQRVPIGGMVGCQVLQGMSDGFCGCLTTVSTWVAELTGLRLRHAYFYGFMSVGVALGLMVIIMGSLQWTDGFNSVLCTA